MLSDDESITSLAPLQVRAQHHRAAVAAAGPPVPRPLRARRPQLLRPDRDRRRDHRLERAPTAKAYGDDKLGAVGRPHAGVEVRTDDATGELQVRTPALSAGYADGADLADRLTADGWFRTGDVGRVDDDGFVWIEGRLSDMINRGGLKVFPGEVEEVLRLSPDVADAAVVGCRRRPPRRGAVGLRRRRRGAAVDVAALEALLPRAPGAVQGAGALRGRRCAAAQRGRQGPRPPLVGSSSPRRASSRRGGARAARLRSRPRPLSRRRRHPPRPRCALPAPRRAPGVGGRVEDGCLRCPFHGWTWDGESGQCVEIPYGDVTRSRQRPTLGPIPPSSATT